VAEAEENEQRSSLDRLVGNVVAEKYRVDRLIGRGGMGAVFQATNLTIGKRVALKFLDRDATRDRDAFERFQREARAASLVESAHIVQLFDSGTAEDGRPFLVMELLTGEDLRSRLKREEKLPVELAIGAMKQILRALVRAHAAGIVHRDLKPDNVFLCERDDGGLFVKIVDFGISKLTATSTLDTLTRRGTVLGTAYYMSPEQAQAFPDVDGRTDLFSAGAILFECLSGRPPHVGPTYESVLVAICTKDAPNLRELEPAVPDELAQIVGRALSREREQRFQRAEEFLAALTTFLPTPIDQVDSSARPRTSLEAGAPDAPALSSTSRTQVGLQRARSWVAGGAAVLLGFAMTAFWMGQRRAPDAVSSEAEALRTAAAAAPALPIAPASTAREPSAVPAGSASTDVATPSAPTASVAPASSATGEGRVKKRGPAPGKSERPRPSVAPGLELSTQGP
jgi:eukaryotic-like serine/threonine-protein kinase